MPPTESANSPTTRLLGLPIVILDEDDCRRPSLPFTYGAVVGAFAVWYFSRDSVKTGLKLTLRVLTQK